MFVKAIICVSVLVRFISTQEFLNKTENEATSDPSISGFNKTIETLLPTSPEASTMNSISLASEITALAANSNSSASGLLTSLPAWTMNSISMASDIATLAAESNSSASELPTSLPASTMKSISVVAVTDLNSTPSLKRKMPVPDDTKSYYPETCDNRKKLPDPDQAVQTDFSKIKKCCPLGESLQRQDQDFICDTEKSSFSIEPIDVLLFHDCIEDQETKVELDIEAGNPCNMSFVYGIDTEDQFYVIQNGSLLLLDGNHSFEIHNKYCLDFDYKTAAMIAIVCSTSVDNRVSQIQTILYAICMMMSFPCLLVAAYLCLRIKELRTLHGMCFASICYCLAVGFCLHTISQMSTNVESKLGYAVQYFMLAYFFWLFMTCLNVVLHVWIYVPYYITMTKTIKRIHYGIYFIFAMTIPMTLVLITKAKRIPGMPSYFYQGWSESIRTSQRYFIPPVSGALFLSFIALIVAYFGFRQLRVTLLTRLIDRENMVANGSGQTATKDIDRDLLEDTRFNGKSISIIVSVVIVNWILEVITFYTPRMGNFFLLDIANALQGVFILLIFLTIKERQHIIARWWSDRGEHDCTEVEMTELQKKPDRV